MFVAMGVGAYAAGIFHLYTHAFFKACLFLGSGAVIHALAGEQDIRKMGGLRKELPITYWTFLIASLAIAGFPFLSGFFSKDEILWKAFSGGHTVVWAVAAAASLLTAIYMFRLVFLTFHGKRTSAGPGEHAAGASLAVARDDHASVGGHLHDAPPAMATALIILAIGSVAAGYIGIPAVIGGGNQIEHFLAPSFAAPGMEHSAAAASPDLSEAAHGAAEANRAEARGEMALGGEPTSEGGEHRAELTLMAFSSGLAIAGIGLAAFFWLRSRALTDRIAASFAGVHRVLLNKYYVDEFYDAAIVQPIKGFSGRFLWKIFDAGVIDGVVNGAGTVVNGWGAILRRLQTGSMRAYALSVFVGVVMILGYYVWR
jgi:NADH-quinone oxidoreductase subunit L